MKFTPIIMPEDKAPPEIAQAYEQCQICEKSRLVWGEGNPKAPIMVILDNPGAREDKDGTSYICGTRITLQEIIAESGINLNDIYITYLLKCRPKHAYDKEDMRAFSKPFLIEQIETMQPKFLAILGNTAIQAMFGDSLATAKELRGRWHTIMGIPTIVSFHPLAARSMRNLRPYFLQDWQMLMSRLRDS